MFIRMRLFLLILFSGFGITVEAAFSCKEAGKGGCLNCATAVLCRSDGSTLKPEEVTCDQGKVCGVESDVGNCYDLAETQAESCKCTTSPGFLKDAYDETYYYMCLPDDLQYLLKCPSGHKFDEASSQCVSALTTTTATPGVECKEPGFATVPGCTKYYGCFPDPSDPTKLKASPVSECSVATEVFDVHQGQCVEKESLIPKFACDTATIGGQIDVVECNAFYVCSGGTQIGSIQCCKPDERFDSSKHQCVPADQIPDSECPVVSDCIDKSTLNTSCSDGTLVTTVSKPITSVSGQTTVNGTSVTSNTNTTTPAAVSECPKDGYNPYPGDCTKYYKCSNGSFTVETCVGSLYFDATSGYCDLPSKVTGC